MRQSAMVLAVVAMLFTSAATVTAEVGWCGNVYPNDGMLFTSDQDINCYIQVWKEGVTDQPGQGADIAATLFYRCLGDATYTEQAMTYNTDVGNNDEYVGTIPGDLGCDTLQFYCEVTDLTDATTCDGPDQNLDDPPFLLTITAVTSQDVSVNFHLCLPLDVENAGDVCVTGQPEQLTNWGNGVPMVFECPEDSPRTYIATVLFPAGSSPAVEYKYKKDNCDTWESSPNRNFVIDDTSPLMDLSVDTWDNETNDCPACLTAADETTWGTIKALYE